MFSLTGEAQTDSLIKLNGAKHAPGSYQGVLPGSGNPPAVNVAPGTIPIRATWLGFQPLADGGSRFFVQLTSKIEIEIGAGGSERFIVILKNVRVAGRNNRRPLETKLFNTPVTKAFLRHKKRDTELVFELRSASVPIITNQAGAEGYHFVLFDFPSGDFLSEQTPPPV